MEKFTYLREVVSAACGFFGSAIVLAFGGWDHMLTGLVLMMAADYVTGLAVAAIFKASPKTESGGLESKAGLKGLARKTMTLILVAGMHQIDVMLGIDYLMNAAIIGFFANEVISLTENAGLMGIPLPSAITKAIDVLTKKADEEEAGD